MTTDTLNLKATAMPQADGLPLLGSAIPMLRDPLAFLRQQTQKHGPIFRLRAGNRDLVVLSGVEANRLMTEEGKSWFVSNDFWGKLTDRWQCPHFISALDGEAHMQDRKKIKPTMSRIAANEKQDQLQDVIRRTVEQHSRDGAFSARDLTRALTNNELHLIIAGEEADVDPVTARSLAEYQRISFNVLVLGKWPIIMLYMPHYLAHRRRALAFVDKLRQQAEANPPESGFFKVIMDMQKQGGRTEGDYAFNFLAPFWAGLDTLGASLTFLLQEWLARPELRMNVLTELNAAIAANNGQLPGNDELRNLPYLYGFCMEILRLNPVAFAMGRSAAQDFEFEGHSIRKGQNLLVFTSATHFDGQYFPNPDELNPLRHSAPLNEHRQRYAFNPFGRGPHICLGAGMAESMLLTTAATLISEYDISATRPGQRYPMIFDPSPTLPSRFQIRMRPRVAN